MSVTKEQLDHYLKMYMEAKSEIDDEEKEIWKDVSYRDIKPNIYQVSSYGRIRRKDTLKLMTPNIRGNGYAYVRLTIGDGGHSRIFTIHRIVAYHFCDGYDMVNANIVNHIDGVKINNFYKNLEWCDQKHNAQHAFDTGLQKVKYGDESNRHFISNELAERICKMLIEYNGSIKPILDILINEDIYCTFGIIESIKQKETWSHISDKYFTKDFFRNLIEEDVKNICENIVKYNGNRDEILKHAKTKTISLNRRLLSDIITKTAYKEISDNYFTRDDFIFKNNFSEDDIHRICELLVKYKGAVNMVYDDLKDEVPNITTDRISYIKNKGSYVSISDQYFEQSQFNNIDVEDLDFIRELLMTETFKYSPTQVYDALNHKKYPRLTLNIIRMINSCSHDVYNRYERISIEYFMDHKDKSIYSEISNKTLSKLINSYNAGFSDITDSSYDSLLEEYLKEHGEDSRPFLRATQSDNVNDIVGTLTKVYGVTEPMRSNQKTYKEWAIKRTNSQIIAQPKFDGCSVAYDCKENKFFTRGDYENGEATDVTFLFKDILSTNVLGIKDFDNWDAIKFEAILSNDFYKQNFIDKYKSARDVVQAAITSRNNEMISYVMLQPLRYYKDGKQYICDSVLKRNSTICQYDDYVAIQERIKDILSNNASVEYNDNHYLCDGVVVSIIKNQTDDFIEVDPSNEVAIKILNMVNETKLIDVEYQFGKSGRITPVAIVEPTYFEGKQITHITLSTLDRVVALSLKHNDTVRIAYNIVPYLIDSYNDGDSVIQIPKECPICNHPFDLSTLKQVRCTNPNCRGLKVGSIIRYCEKMKMFGVSEGIITRLFDEGVINDISDLYKITIDTLKDVSGFGEVSANNIINSIKRASSDITVARWLGSLPFDNISVKTWELLMKTLTQFDPSYEDKYIHDMLSFDSPEYFIEQIMYAETELNGVRESKLKSIFSGLINNWDLMKECIKYITFKEQKESGPLICLSGTRDKKLINTIREFGCEYTDSLTKKCALLVIPDHSYQSSKIDKAKKMNIPIESINEFMEDVKLKMGM